MKKYNIIRFFFKKYPKIIKKNVSLQEAQKHCNKKNTIKIGKWFDGYNLI